MKKRGILNIHRDILKNAVKHRKRYKETLPVSKLFMDYLNNMKIKPYAMK